MAFNPGGGSGISSAADVALSSPANNQVLAYNSATAKWKNVAQAAGTADSWVYNVKDYGALGDGATDDSVAIKACVAAAIATRGAGTGPVRAEIIFPPGNYYVTQNDTLMTASDGSANVGIYGLVIRGFGKDVSKIIFDPSTTSSDPFVGNLASFNKRARHLSIRDMSFQSNNAAANCFYFFDNGAGSQQNQDDMFERLHFSGDWNRVFGFDGDATANLNSEMTFNNISGSGATYADAFFHVGGISGLFNQQNQFLDYWFNDSSFTLNGGTLIKIDKGGSAHFRNGSWSSGNNTTPMTFINIQNNGLNNTSAAQFTFSNIRFEPKASNQMVLDTATGQGSIHFSSCIDLSSLQNTASYDYKLHRVTTTNPWGFGGTMGTIRYTNCHLAGYHSYEGPAAARGRYIYDGCYFYRGNNGEMANATTDQSSTTPVVRWTSGKPRYTFRDCWNVDDISL